MTNITPAGAGKQPSAAQTDLQVAFARLRRWSRDEEHVVQSARHWEPTYANPAALRADVRLVLDELVKARIK